MFSDSGAPVSGEQKGFKPHAPHFIPWLRGSLKPHHSSDLGLNGPYKSASEARNSLTPLERARGIGFFSIPGKERAKKAELRCNGVGMARMLPVVLRGHHILKQREESPAGPKQTKEPSAEISSGGGPQGDASSTPQENHTLARNHLSLRRPQSDGTSGRKYGPLVGPPPVPLLTEETNCKVPAVMEDRRGKAWDGNPSSHHHHRELRSSSWLSSDTQGLTEKQQSFSSSFSYISKHSRSSQSHRDLREPPVEGFNGPLNGVIFSTEVPHRGLGCTTTLRGPRRPNSEWISILGQNQTWVQPRPSKEGESVKKEAGCSRKVVRNQIKRVMDNLEQVLKALRDVHQEMKEVVQQIDYLTSSIDLNEEEEQQEAGGDGAKPPSDSSYSSGSSSSEATVGGSIQRPSEPESLPGTTDSSGFLRRNHPCRSQSPVLAALSERSRTLRFTCSVGSPPRQGGLLQCSNNLPSRDLSPQRSLPVRPPTPGLSPLTVNLHPPGSPGSQPPSPAASSSSVRISPPSPKPHPPPSLSPSVIIETPQSPPAAGRPPADSIKERRAAGPPHPSAASAAKPPAAQGRRGRKPPPYPHHRLSEQAKKAKEPREAPPYPEKRRLLSTTV